MNELIKIKEMTGKYDVSARTLRYYEDMGLMTSIRSDDYAYRLYDEAAVKRLEQILILRKLNVSIKDIKRVFSAPGSAVVLDVLGQKVNAIDDEVALLHELKEIVLAFIRQIQDADFSNDGDVKQLYEKARDIETQLVNVDYNGQPNVSRLIEVTEKLEKKQEIIKRLPHCYNIFSVANPVEVCELYEKAFGAVKVSDEYPGGAALIGIEMNGFFILLRQEEASVVAATYRGQGCCARFDTEEDLRKAYAVLRDGGSVVLHEDWEWTSLVAAGTDKFGVNWLLCI